jgi:hypothetical protein
MRKFCFTIAMVFALLLGTSAVSAQTVVLAERTMACTLNPGYTVADVVETARNFSWSEDTSPAVVVMRNKVAASGVNGNFGPQFDFLVSSYYPSYADMVEKRGNFLRSQAGRNGIRGIAPFATCNDNIAISSVRFATPLSGAPIPPLTASASTFCELNGATIDDAVAMHAAFSERVGASIALVGSRSFGGPRRPINSTVGYTAVFPSFDDFGAAWDELQQNPVAPDPDNPISCTSPSLWAQYLIHQQTPE